MNKALIPPEGHSTAGKPNNLSWRPTEFLVKRSYCSSLFQQMISFKLPRTVCIYYLFLIKRMTGIQPFDSKATDRKNSPKSQSKNDLGLSGAPCRPTRTYRAFQQQSREVLFPTPLGVISCKRATAERKMWFWHLWTRKGVKAGQDTRAREKTKGRAGGPANTHEATPTCKRHRRKTNSPLLSNSSSNPFPKTLWALWYSRVWSIITKIS